MSKPTAEEIADVIAQKWATVVPGGWVYRLTPRGEADLSPTELGTKQLIKEAILEYAEWMITRVAK